MKRITALTAVFLLFAVVASAKMNKPGSPSPSPSPGSGIAAGYGDMENMGPMELIIAPDGTVLVIERTPTSFGTFTHSLVAYNGNTGAEAWSYELGGKGGHQLEVVGTLVVFGTGRGSRAETTSTLTALNLSNGAEAWTLELDGFAMEIEASTNQIYVIVAKPNGLQPGESGRLSFQHGPAERTLLAVSLSGTVLWSKPLG
jgi:outer membrane protein assembly factor BamB